ncbi:MAG: helix-turn-helix domain-containing protein, partial [Clostridiales bacterium]|nr:helix-turn-helix domain-containing protein [Clostridiales bacterium]
QRTLQRWNKNGTKDLRAGAKKSVPRKLAQEKCDEIYRGCCSARFKDSNPHEIYHILLDEGVYLASESSFYRILRQKKAIVSSLVRNFVPEKNRKSILLVRTTFQNQVCHFQCINPCAGCKNLSGFLFSFFV